MIDQGTLRSDFRFRGFPSYSMQSPRQPIIPGLSDDKRRSEENFMRVFGRSSIFDPAQPTSEEIHRERKYYQPPFETDIPQRPRGIRDPFNEKTSAEVRKLKQMEMDAEQDILNMKQQKLAQDFRREEEKKRDYELLSKYYPWDRFNRGHGAPKADNDNRRRKFLETELSPRDTFTYRKEAGNSNKGHDLFIDTLGGPGGTVVRQNGAPGLQSMPDPRVGAFRSPGQGFPVQHERRLDLAIEEKKIAEQEQRIKELKKELEYLKSPRDQQLPHKPGDPRFGGGSDEMFSRGQRATSLWKLLTKGSKSNPYSKTLANQFADFDPPRKEERRSLDLDSSRGGAGAPLRNDQGKPITRLPITMVRDDSGASKIREQIPGKQYTLPDEDNPVYFPFGMPGGGAPVRDRRGNVITNTFGNFEKKKDSADQRKYARAKEVLLQDLKVGIEEQHRKQEEDKRDLQAPFGELAELVRAGQVGKPRRDPITGSLANQHLGISDVSKLNTDRRGGNGAQKMNYQPKEISEKKIYYDELTQLAEERERARQLEKLREKQESNRHFDVFDHKWGALGGGAPKDRLVRKKVNLDNALFHQGNESRSEADLQRSHESHYGLEMTAQPQSVSSNQKRLFDDDICQSNDVTPRFVKNTVKSNSRNMYEYSLERASKPVSTGPPYATQGAYY